MGGEAPERVAIRSALPFSHEQVSEYIGRGGKAEGGEWAAVGYLRLEGAKGLYLAVHSHAKNGFGALFKEPRI